MRFKDPPWFSSPTSFTSYPEFRNASFISSNRYGSQSYVNSLVGKMLAMNARDVESILERYGFQLISQKGSHRKWRNDFVKRQVIVPDHGTRQLPKGTLRSIFKGAEIPDSEWKC